MQDDGLFLTVVKLWAAAAWADGVLAPRERHILEHLIAGAKLDDAARQKAQSYLQTRVDLADTDVASLSPKERQGVYRTACRMVLVDEKLVDEERAFLNKLAGRLGLDAETTGQIEAVFLKT